MASANESHHRENVAMKERKRRKMRKSMTIWRGEMKISERKKCNININVVNENRNENEKKCNVSNYQ
jgi:Holliday junction resolvase-like predicted endonuclease